MQGWWIAAAVATAYVSTSAVIAAAITTIAPVRVALAMTTTSGRGG